MSGVYIRIVPLKGCGMIVHENEYSVETVSI